MSRIASAFESVKLEKGKGFVPFITAGDPDLETTRQLLVELANSGATVIELGVPFSDPMADGPVIQRASERALKHGFGITQILEVVADAQPDMRGVPVVLFSYFNPLFQFGLDRLARESASSGVDGVLVTDLIPEEAGSCHEVLKANGLDMIFLVAPTSSGARLKMIADRASGFIYAVSRAGVTGERSDISVAARQLVERLRTVSDLPVAVGFGISTPEQVAGTLQYADAAVVGSAIVSRIETLGMSASLVPEVGAYCRELVG